jgi:hypothetical protein
MGFTRQLAAVAIMENARAAGTADVVAGFFLTYSCQGENACL